MKQTSLLFFISCFFLILVTSSSAQTVKLLSFGTNTAIRGLSVVNDQVLWVSGSDGMVARSVDSGKNFEWTTVKGFEKTEFRDIEAFDENIAIIMAIAEPAYILRTTDGGRSWNEVYENREKGMFLDAMDFYQDKNGIAIGDPLDKKFFMIASNDSGKTWNKLPAQKRPVTDSGEACFASSGTNIRKTSATQQVFISGGTASHFFYGDKYVPLPLITPGLQTTGANSVAVKNKKILIVVGGNFSAKDDTAKNCLLTSNGGKTWRTPAISPHGYRSCVEYLGKKNWIASGLNGVDYSVNEGKTWTWISKESYHVCRKAKRGTAVYFAGSNGRIGKLIF